MAEPDHEVEDVFGHTVLSVPPADFPPDNPAARDEDWAHLADFFVRHPSIYDNDAEGYLWAGLLVVEGWYAARLAAGVCVELKRMCDNANTDGIVTALRCVHESLDMPRRISSGFELLLDLPPPQSALLKARLIRAIGILATSHGTTKDSFLPALALHIVDEE